MTLQDVKDSVKEYPSIWLLSITFVAGFVFLQFWSGWNGLTFIKVDATNLVAI